MTPRAIVSVVALVVGLVFSASRAVAQDRAVLTGVEPARAFVGETVQYAVALVNCPDSAQPVVGSGDGFELTFAHKSQQTRSVIDERGRRDEHRMTFVYRLKLTREGTHTIPAPTVDIDGDTLRGPPRTVVAEKNEQDWLILEASASSTEVVRQDTFELRLDIFVRDVPEQGDTDPLTVQNGDAELDLPWLAVPEGLGAGDLQAWARGHLSASRRRGFRIAQFKGTFFDGAPTFLPKAERVRRKGLDGREHGYHRYRLTLPLKALRAGTYRLPSVTMRAMVANRAVVRESRFGRRQGGLEGRKYVAFADGPVVTVRDAPTEGRPATYTGGVGAFTIRATAAPTTLKVGDPLTVTILVEGDAGLEDVGALALADQPEIASRFKVYEDRPTGEVSGRTKRFVHSMRPLAADVDAVPPIEFSYFDGAEKVYKTLRTDPIPLEVREAEKLDLTEVVVNEPDAGRTELTERAGGIFANRTDVDGLGNERVRPMRWFGAVGGMAALYAALAFALGWVRRRNADPAAVRRRGAFAAARARLADEASLDAIHAAFAEVTARVRDVPAEGLTARDVGAFTRAMGDEALASEIETLLGACEAAQFGGASAGDVGRLRSQASELLDRLERRYRDGGRSALGVGATAVLIAALLAGAASAQGDRARAFLDAQRAYEQATSPDDYAAAASRFRALLAGGAYENGAVLYNLGNAYYRAGELGLAIAAYRQAERHRPGDPELAANLREALSRRVDKFPPPGKSLADHVLFWTRSVPYRTQFVWLIVAAGVAFGLGVVRLVRPGWPGVGWGAVGALVLAVVLGAGGALAYYRNDVQVHGVVVAAEAEPRKAPNGAAAFDQPIHEGTEFVVTESRATSRTRWLRIRFAGDREGWIPADRAVTLPLQ